MHEQNTPLIRLAKRDDMPRGQVWCIRGGSFVAAILLGALIFLIMGHSPVSAYGTILSGSLGKKTAVWQTVKIAIPLLGTALAIAPLLQDAVLEYRGRGADHRGGRGGQLLCPLLVRQAALSGAAGGHGGVRRAVRRPVGPDPSLFQGQMGYQRDPLHSDDELYHHRCGQMAPGRPLGGAAPGPRSSRSSTPPPYCPRSSGSTAAGSSCWR